VLGCFRPLGGGDFAAESDCGFGDVCCCRLFADACGCFLFVFFAAADFAAARPAADFGADLPPARLAGLATAFFVLLALTAAPFLLLPALLAAVFLLRAAEVVRLAICLSSDFSLSGHAPRRRGIQ